MKYTRSRLTLVTGILMGTLFVMLIGIPDSAEAAQVTGQITLDNPEQRANVGPGESGIVRFTGTVNVAIMGPGSCVTTVLASIYAVSPWPTTITPKTILFTAANIGTAQPFEAAVKVPNFTSFNDTGEIIIRGRIKTITGDLTYRVPETKGNISIAPYFKLRVSCDEPHYEITPGKKFMYEIKIKNEGNSRDRVRIRVDEECLEKLSRDGFVVSLGTPMLSIEEGKEDIIPISVTGSSEWTLYQNHISTIKVIVKSETSVLQGASPESYEYTLFMRERSIFIPGFEPILVVMALAVVTIAARKVAGRRG